MPGKELNNDTIYSRLYRGDRISDPVHSYSSGRMDHRQIFSYDKGCQLSPDHPGSISLHPLDYRRQSHSDWRRKCAKRYSSALYRQPQKLL